MRVEVVRRNYGRGWIRVTCDAPGCRARVEGHPYMGEQWPPDWEQDLRPSSGPKPTVLDYCPEHGSLASAA
jgi:hypothetical protein